MGSPTEILDGCDHLPCVVCDGRGRLACGCSADAQDDVQHLCNFPDSECGGCGGTGRSRSKNPCRDCLRAEVERLTAWGEAQILEGKNRYGSACEAATRAETERDALRAEVDRLAALFQQTDGCHHSWVDRAATLEKERDTALARVAKLEAKVAAIPAQEKR